jgi:Mce-associated membrane protein
MTSGDEAGALADSEVRADPGSADPGTDARDAPAPAGPDPGGADSTGPAEPADSASAEPGEAGRTAGAGIWAISVAVLCALLIAGLVTAGIFWNRAGKASAATDGQQAAIAAAKTGVGDLLTADYRNPGAWSARLKPVAAGQFLSVVSNSASGFKAILAQGKVQTAGKVVSAGVEKFGGTTAQLAVLAYESVKNTETPSGSERAYRMTVSMVQSGSKWLVSNVEFVQ